MKRAIGSTCSRSPGRQKKRQRSSKSGLAPVELSRHLRQPGERQEVGEGALGLLDRQLEHLAAQRRQHDRHLLGGRGFKLEAALGALPGQRHLQELERLPHLGQRLLEGDPVPAFDDPVRGGADAEHEAPVRGRGERRRLLRKQRRPALEDADDAGAEPRPLGPSGGEGERGEAVRAGGLAAPEVGVAERLGPLHVLLVRGQGDPRQRQRQSPTTLHGRGPYSLRRRWPRAPHRRNPTATWPWSWSG